MIAMPVYRPMCEDDIGTLGKQDAAEVLVMWSINNGPAVVLARKRCPCFQRAPSVLRFGGADISTAVEAGAPECE